MILERVKFGGSTTNPATVTRNVLAQLFEIDEVIVLDATYNAAALGAPIDMQFVCDSKGALLLYSPSAPMIDTPSAGMIFTWAFNGSDYIAIDKFQGEAGSYTNFISAVIAYDMQITSQALAVYCANCVSTPTTLQKGNKLSK